MSTSITVNGGSSLSTVDLSNTTPAPPTNGVAVKWQEGTATASGHILLSDLYSHSDSKPTIEDMIEHANIQGLGWAESGHTIEVTEGTRIAGFVDGVASPLNASEVFAFIEEQVGDAVGPLVADSMQATSTIIINLLTEQIEDVEEAGETALANAVTTLEASIADVASTGTTALAGAVSDLEGQIDAVSAAGEAAIAALSNRRATPLYTMSGIPSCIEYMEAGAENTGSSSPGVGRPLLTVHFQEGPARDFTEISITVGSTNSGYTVATALYAVNANGEPTDLIWVGNAISTGTAGVKTWDLTSSSSGTWQSAAGAYKGTGDVLHLEYGQTVVKGFLVAGSGAGGPTFRTVGNPRCVWGRSRNAATKPWTALQTNGVSAFPTTFVFGTGSTEFELINSAIPVIGLG